MDLPAASPHGIGFDAEPAARLYDELSRLTVIDAHEHLMPVHERIRRAHGRRARAARLYDEGLSRLTVIDAHEHLMPEHERIRRAPDAVLKEAPRAGVDAHP